MYYLQSKRKKEDQTAKASKYPQGYFKDRECRMCFSMFSPNSPCEFYCSDKCQIEGSTSKYLQRNYGITLEDYKNMYKEQEGLCAICRTEGFTMAAHHRLKLVVDHCHNTGVVRGLLCHNCNRALGLLQDSTDNLERAMGYLKVQRLSERSTPKQVEAVGPQ